MDDGGVTDESSGSAEPVTDDEAPQPAQTRRLRLLLAVAAVVLVLDIVTKVLAVRLLTPGQPVSIVGDTITWTLVRNSGAAFSMATGYTWILTLIATAVVIGIVWMGRRLVSPWWALGLGMVVGVRRRGGGCARAGGGAWPPSPPSVFFGGAARPWRGEFSWTFCRS